MSYVQILMGFVLLLGGAEFLVRGAVRVAAKAGLSPMLIGMTVVAFGTSAPEFVVSLNAALDGAPGMAVGNVVGSNIANIWLILGTTALVAPVVVDVRAVIRDAMMLLSSSLLFVWVSLSGNIQSVSGLVLVLILLAYFTYAYVSERGVASASTHLHERETEEFQDTEMNIWLAWGALLGGLVALSYGAELLVTGGVSIARSAGVPEEVIGLTVIAFGTSLPELATSVVAAWRGHTDVAIGNVIGSNLFNILGVAGGVAAITTLPVAQQIRDFDMWVMLAATVMLLALLVLGVRLGRRVGGVFLGLYIAYIVVQIQGVDWILAGLG